MYTYYLLLMCQERADVGCVDCVVIFAYNDRSFTIYDYMRSGVGCRLGCVDCDIASVYLLAICLRSGVTAMCLCLPLWVHFDVISTNNDAVIPYIPDTFVLTFWVC